MTKLDIQIEMDRRAGKFPPGLWTNYGAWAKQATYDEAHSRETLARLEPFMLHPDGGCHALPLPGWENFSRWGFHPPMDAYHAHLWRNPGAAERDYPDILILGRGICEGQFCAVSTTRILAHEIATATGADLAAVCKALLDGWPVPFDDPDQCVPPDPRYV